MRDATLIAYLREASVPESLHAEALVSLRSGQALAARCRPWDLAAPLAWLYLAAITPWAAENIIGRFWRWGNDVSINGDVGVWAWSETLSRGERGAVPLEDTAEARAMNYWLPTWIGGRLRHPRSWLSRWWFCGLRNRAGAYALSLGPAAQPLTVEQWGDPLANNGRAGVKVARMAGGVWQVFRVSRAGHFCVRRNLGYKVLNTLGDTPMLRAMVVWTPWSLQRWKGEA